MDGYAQFFAYLGQEGYGVNVNLSEGSTHLQKEAAAFLSHSLDYARCITDLPLLVRLDAGNDALENLNVCLNEKGGFYRQAQSSPGIARGMADDRQGGGTGCAVKNGKANGCISAQWSGTTRSWNVRFVSCIK
ncbi:hypothetical protein ACFTAO_39445 [Paenibacillus rhizoplanae]